MSCFNNKKILALSAVFCILLLISSCNNNGEEDKQLTADSITILQDIAQEDSALIIENKANEWLDLSLNDESGSWKKFKLQEFWYEDSMQEKPFKPGNEFYTDYASLLKWSPDSSYVLDIGTYGKVPVKDKKGNIKIEDGEIDTKASLIFPNTNTVAELIFLGAGGTFIDGRWIDSTQFSILGVFDEKGNQQPDTLLWVIDAKERFFRKYKRQ